MANRPNPFGRRSGLTAPETPPDELQEITATAHPHPGAMGLAPVSHVTFTATA